MSKSTVKGRILRASAAAVWAVFVWLWVCRGVWYPAAGLLVLHAAETILAGIPTGRAKGYSLFYSLAMCMLFGFTWWKFLSETGEE